MSESNRIDVMNDFIAIIQDIASDSSIIVEQDVRAKLSNEGTIVGIGPDASASGLGFGDVVVVQPKNYNFISPSNGPYKGKEVKIVRVTDILVRISKKSLTE